MKCAAFAAAVLAASAAAASAAQPIPLQAGTYCGPNDARIVVDVARDQIEIDGMMCSFPVIAADHLQSDLCSTKDGKSVPRNVDFSVVGRDFAHAGSWYRLCGPVTSADAPTPAGAATVAKPGG